MSSGGYETISEGGLQDPTGYSTNILNQLKGQSSNLIGTATRGGGDTSSAVMNSFMSQFPQLTGMVTEATAPLSEQLNQQVDYLTNRAVGNVGQQFSNLNSLYSSGMGKTAGEAAGEIASQAGTTLAQNQLGLLNTLGGQALGGTQSAYSQEGQNALSLLGFGAPQYEASQVAYQPSTFEQMLGYGSQLSSMALPFFLL